MRLGDAVLSRNWIEPAAYYQALAQHYTCRSSICCNEPPDPALLAAQDADVYTCTLTMPWRAARRPAR